MSCASSCLFGYEERKGTMGRGVLLKRKALPSPCPHNSGPIQWARGLKPSAAARPSGLRWKKTNAPITPIRPLSGDSAPLDVIHTAATRGGDGSYSRGGWVAVRKDTNPVKKNTRWTKPSGSRSQVLPMANDGTKLGV